MKKKAVLYMNVLGYQKEAAERYMRTHLRIVMNWRPDYNWIVLPREEGPTEVKFYD